MRLPGGTRDWTGQISVKVVIAGAWGASAVTCCDKGLVTAPDESVTLRDTSGACDRELFGNYRLIPNSSILYDHGRLSGA